MPAEDCLPRVFLLASCMCVNLRYECMDAPRPHALLSQGRLAWCFQPVTLSHMLLSWGPARLLHADGRDACAEKFCRGRYRQPYEPYLAN